MNNSKTNAAERLFDDGLAAISIRAITSAEEECAGLAGATEQSAKAISVTDPC